MINFGNSKKNSEIAIKLRTRYEQLRRTADEQLESSRSRHQNFLKTQMLANDIDSLIKVYIFI